MKTAKIALLGVLALAACTKDPEGQNKTDAADRNKVAYMTDAVQGELLVKFTPEGATRAETRSGGASQTGIEAFDAVLAQIGATEVEMLFPNEGPSKWEQTLSRWYLVRFSPETKLGTAAEKLAGVAEVDVVQYNGHMEPTYDTRPMTALRAETRAETRAVQGSNYFNDPMLPGQWNYKNMGDKTLADHITAGADINVEPAWMLCGGDPSIVVAVMDEGVAFSHPDLAANMFVNEAERDGNPGVDDDKNGYVDDLHGFDFVNNTGNISWNKMNDSGHGTHVAGTVAAVNDNGIGVAGVAGGNNKIGDKGVRILGVQAISNGKTADLSKLAKAVDYARSMGALVLQCSMGAAGAPKYNTDEEFEQANPLFADAIKAFVNTPRPGAPLNGGIAIFSGGNNGLDHGTWPGRYTPIVCVGAITADFTPATYSNYGEDVDICAPGGETYDAGNGYLKESQQIRSTYPVEYQYMAGTSMAAPHVSGVAALGLSYAKKLGKTFEPAQFRSMLMASVQDMTPHLVGQKIFTSYDDAQQVRHNSPMVLENYRGKFGTGLVDAYKMLLNVRGVPSISPGVGTAFTVALNKYYGDVTGPMTQYDFTVDDQTKADLGMTIERVDDATVRVTCTKQGSGMAHVSSAAGGTQMTRDVAIIVRAKVPANGGWLRR